jgi:hypothetical protein
MGTLHYFLKFLFARSARELGTEFEFELFGMKTSDCTSLASAIKNKQLSVLQLANNSLDDSRIALLVDGLKHAPSVTSLGTKRLNKRGS